MAKQIKPTLRQHKMCVACHEVKPLSEYYRNRGWREQKFCDVYCRDCAKKMMVDKESARRYFWENNRLWSDEIWEAAKKTAAYRLANDEAFLRKNSSREARETAENRAIALAVLGVMNLTSYYAFSDNINEDADAIEFDPDSDAGTVVMGEDGDISKTDAAKMYSERWNGKFTRTEIEYMDNYYQKICDAFSIDDIAMEDNVRKCAKASLLYDSAYNRYREGKATMEEVKAAQRMFDENLKTANLAACKRKEKVSEVMALGKIVAMIENEGLLQTTTVKFKPDDIDRIIQDFAHTAVAIGEEAE